MGKATSKVRRNHYKIERRRNDDLVEYSVKKLGQTNVSKKKIGRVLLFATISFFVFYLAFSLFCIGLIIAINNGKSTKKTIVNDLETKVNTIDYTKKVDVQEPVVMQLSSAKEPVVKEQVVKKEEQKSSVQLNHSGLSDYEFNLLSKLVYAEAGIEPFEGKLAVASVVLNRRASNRFPNTIESVIYQKGQFADISSIVAESYDEEIMQDCKRAVEHALTGWDPSYGALYFYNPNYCSSYQNGIRNGRISGVVQIGNHIFYRGWK